MIIGIIFAWIVGIITAILYLKKAAVRTYMCRMLFFVIKIVGLLILPFLLLVVWLYEPLWEQICLLFCISEQNQIPCKVHVWWVLLLFTVIIITGCYVAFFRHKKRRVQQSPRSILGYEHTQKDIPIQKWEEDLLHRRPFVEVLKTAIMRADVRHGAEYIGVFGDWGMGKSSVINLLKHDMKADKSAVFVDFDPWDFRSADDAIDGFMRVIADVALRSGAHAVGDSFSDYLQTLRLRRTDADYGSVGLLIEVARWKLYHLVMNSRRHKLLLSRHLRLMSRRIVVVLDDLERMSQDDVSEILRAIKTNLNLPNLVFLIASSKRHLLKAAAAYLRGPGESSNGDAKAYEDEKECLIKIVQYQFSLPSVPQNDILSFFKVKLRKVLNDNEYPYDDYDIESDNGDGYETVREYVHTLRSVLLLSNSVWEALAYLRKLSPDGTLNIHVGDLVALCAIRLIDEKFYHAIPNLFAMFKKTYEGRFLTDNKVTEQEFNSWKSKNMTRQHEDCDIAFLKKRLGLEELQGNNGTKEYILNGFWGGRQEMLAQYRLASPECYREYFFDSSAIRRVSKEIIIDFTRRIENEKTVVDIFEDARERGELPNLILALEGMSQFSSDEITLFYFKQLFVLASVKFENNEYTYLGLDGFADNIYTAIWRCAIRYCGKYRQATTFGNVLSNMAHVGGLLFNAIKTTPEVHLIWRWLSYEHKNYENDKRLAQQYSDIASDLMPQSSFFSWEQYEALQDVYLDEIEKFGKEDCLFVDKEFFDLMRGWNICLIAKNDDRRYANLRSILKSRLLVLSNVVKLIPFITQSEVRFGDAVQIGEAKFLPIDCSGALRLFGKELLSCMNETLSTNKGVLNATQRATARALEFVVEKDFDETLCDNAHQLSMIREWMNKNIE